MDNTPDHEPSDYKGLLDKLTKELNKHQDATGRLNVPPELAIALESLNVLIQMVDDDIRRIDIEVTEVAEACKCQQPSCGA